MKEGQKGVSVEGSRVEGRGVGKEGVAEGSRVE